MVKSYYNWLNNFWGLSLDKTTQVIQNPMMDIKRISAVWFDICHLILFQQFHTKKHEKIHKVCRNNLCAWRNYSEGYKINKPLSGLQICWWTMPLAERLSSEFSQLPSKLHFSDNCSFLGPFLPAAKRGLFTKYSEWLGFRVRVNQCI